MANLQSQIDILAKAIVRNFIRNTTLSNLNDVNNLVKINEKLNELENRLKKLEDNQNDNGGGGGVTCECDLTSINERLDNLENNQINGESCDCTLKSIDDEIDVVVSNPTYGDDFNFNQSLLTHLEYLHSQAVAAENEADRLRGF